MPEEFEGDLAGAVFWGADLSGARFRDVNLTDAKISHAWLVNVVFEEKFWHNRYAQRDLAQLEGAT